MMLTAAHRMTMVSLSPPSAPRLRMEPTGSSHTLLDGAWWPRSTDPVAELPGLVLAIDRLRGPVTRLVLGADGWSSHPRRLGVDGRVLRLGYFASQAPSLLTALCANDDRIDLLVVPAYTPGEVADAAMVLAATTGNLLHPQAILLAVGSPLSAETEGAAEAPGVAGPPRRGAGGGH